MYYIRFLKVPKIDENASIKATISICSDLGESVLLDDVVLAASVISEDIENGEIFARKNFKWIGGAHALPISFDLGQTDLEYPVRVHVHVKGARQDRFERHDDTDVPEIVSVFSDIIDPPRGITTASRTVERRFLPLSNRPLRIWEETGDSIARHIWDGGVALTAHLDRMLALQVDGLPFVEGVLSSATYKRLCVLELGCGVGMVGIALAQAVPDVEMFLTDLPDAKEVCERNITAMKPAMSSTCTFVALDWSERLPVNIQNRTFDLILVSECTYNDTSIPALVRTLTSLIARSPRTIICLSTKVRHDSEALFFNLMAEAGVVEASHTHLNIPHDERSGSSGRVEIYIFHGRQRPPAVPALEAGSGLMAFWNN
ncbi:hypothetical protein K402DRAFT_330254 [Aulographum hederae CBS 113979]|uniref:Methyltransferase-domain-containing protein n=1 Tax=Aulographum hederae CBS 113979 TaxID=1176131 RepID=A0A6G1H478_9PEZI|nr:hypothetical protein K402DRAFT_330254 [Aulographum hederae CBS 113979]